MSTSSGPTIAFLGPRGTFTEQATHDFIAAGKIPGLTADNADSATLLPAGSPSKALATLRAGEADYAVVAVESSVEGPVTHTEDALISGERLQIIGETLVPIRFAIGVRAGEENNLPDEPIFSTHPVAEAQVRQWVSDNLPGAKFTPASSNGAAAQAVADGTADVCAAPQRALDLYGLTPLATGVADVAEALTRFALIARPAAAPARTGWDRTGVAFTVKHEPGSLMDALQQLSVRGLNMTRINSRPTRELMGTYVFHIGLVGHIEDSAMADALAGLQRVCSWVRYLGSWPIAEVPGDGHSAVLGEPGSGPPDETDSRDWVAEMINPDSPSNC